MTLFFALLEEKITLSKSVLYLFSIPKDVGEPPH